MRSGLSSWYAGPHSPVKSTCATAGAAVNNTATMNNPQRRITSLQGRRPEGLRLPMADDCPLKMTSDPIYRASHAVGRHFDPSGSFLKSELVMNRLSRY